MCICRFFNNSEQFIFFRSLDFFNKMPIDSQTNPHPKPHMCTSKKHYHKLRSSKAQCTMLIRIPAVWDRYKLRIQDRDVVSHGNHKADKVQEMREPRILLLLCYIRRQNVSLTYIILGQMYFFEKCVICW